MKSKKFTITRLGDDTPQPTASPTIVSDDNSGKKKWIIGGNWYLCTNSNARQYFSAKYQKALDTFKAKFADALKDKTPIEEGLAKLDQMLDNMTEF